MKSRGNSLIELLICLLIASLMLSGLVQAYWTHKKSTQQGEQEINRSLDSSWISALMRQDLQTAGFVPCQRLQQLEAIDLREDYARPVQAIEVSMNPLASIQINSMGPDYLTWLNRLEGQQLVIKGVSNWQKRDALIIADCLHAEVHRIDQLLTRHGQIAIQLHRPINQVFLPPVFIGIWQEKRWSVRPQPEGRGALYYGSPAHQEEISAMINRLQIRWRQKKPKALIELDLGLDSNRLEQILVWVRNQ